MKALALLPAIALAVLAPGCGGGGSASTDLAPPAATMAKVSSTAVKTNEASRPEVLVCLDGYMGAENVGLLMADKRGYFEDAGVDVWIGSPVHPRRPPRYVSEQRDQI